MASENSMVYDIISVSELFEENQWENFHTPTSNKALHNLSLFGITPL